MSVVKEFVDVIRSADKKGTTPYDTQATVTRVEGNTAWVHIPGGVDETPIKMTVSAKAGDVVQVRVSGGTAWLTGNATAPPTDDTQAIKANDTAVIAVKKAEKSAQEADAAQAIAKATNQHFWQRSTDPNNDGAGTGAFVTDEEQDSFLDAIAQDIQPTTQRPLHNLLMNAEGILLRAAKRIRAAFTPSGVAFYDGQGNAASNVVAAFGSDGAQIGNTSDTHLEMDYHSMELTDNEGNTFFHVSDLRDEDGNVTEKFKGDGSTTVFKFQIEQASNTPITVTIDGVVTTAYTYSGSLHRVTFDNAPANGARIEITHTVHPSLVSDVKAYTFGVRNTEVTIGLSSVCEGNTCSAGGNYSHAEGQLTDAIGLCSHAEGYGSDAANSYAHAEGYMTKATGMMSHAQNSNTIAGYNAQTTIGKFNDNQSDTAFEIGNGTDSLNRANALTVDWSGNVEAAGTIKSNGTNVSLQGHTHGLKFTNILTQRSITTTATNYNCAWSGYDALILCSMFYGNVRETIVVPVDAYFKNCNSGSRPILYDSNNDTTYQIYPASNTQVTILANNALGANYGVNIYGVKIE